MRGASRASYAALRDRLAATIPAAPIAAQVGDELFAVTRLLDSEHGLRRALADGTKPGAEKAALITRLLRGRVTQATSDLVAEAAAARWATPGDLADAVEQLAIEALTLAAQYDGTLDDLEDDLFRFARLVSGQPQLRSALDRPGARGGQAGPAAGPAGDEGQRAVAEPHHAGAHPLARALAAGGARPVRFDRGAPAGAAHRGGARGHRADPGAAPAARDSPRDRSRAGSSPQRRARPRGRWRHVRPDRGRADRRDRGQPAGGGPPQAGGLT